MFTTSCTECLFEFSQVSVVCRPAISAAADLLSVLLAFGLSFPLNPKRGAEFEGKET